MYAFNAQMVWKSGRNTVSCTTNDRQEAWLMFLPGFHNLTMHRQSIHVVVQFFSLFKFYFPLFQGMVMSVNEFEANEKQMNLNQSKILNLNIHTNRWNPFVLCIVFSTFCDSRYNFCIFALITNVSRPIETQGLHCPLHKVNSNFTLNLRLIVYKVTV